VQTDFGGASGYTFPSDVQAAILKYKNSGELQRGKQFIKRGREKEKLGKGKRKEKSAVVLFFLPAPHPSDILSFSPQFSQSAVNPK